MQHLGGFEGASQALPWGAAWLKLKALVAGAQLAPRKL